ncbi:U6 small nuclear RNA (adenine-(43)-N(6))-methyltransferase isoform X2 [Spodoptera litura]|uniref:U6 small nuclear RNA (adenine-(43)-N(6))-methyltransferase n=1 Tax=Spodoptera litura TaxID=69820 RepID=A0A9J7EV06_SPOLT|nr:U6 small nuclear RNA (adenine-(43)-N(6))-methyltransferase isoform X2 [Spodoptera litura]
MALNKYMHPRNIYKTPPDFGKLSLIYPEFAAISKSDITGKVGIDFKDPHSLRVLTKCLLKSDFNLEVDIPADRLVPTLPLRLNYILWIEDLMEVTHRKENIVGLDIGTGACAIYPLLGAVKNKWKFVGTESDAESFTNAEENVQRNNLQELIKLTKNSTKFIISHLFTNDDKEQFDFCMCNPPFYSNLQELCESRSPARIFTTMVGHKYNLSVLLQDLKSEGIRHTHAEFCQGRVTRWGLAWTYQQYDLYELVPPRGKPRKKHKPTIFLLPELPSCEGSFEVALSKIKGMLDILCIQHKILDKRGGNITLDIVASNNTWSNQRRKRRLQNRTETDAKVPKLHIEQDSTIPNPINNQVGGESKLEVSEPSKSLNIDDNITNGSEIRESKQDTSSVDSANKTEPLVHAFLKLVKKLDNILLELEFLDGCAGKEGLHQIAQYIKNNWK